MSESGEFDSTAAEGFNQDFQYEDYFDFGGSEHRFMMPDKVSWISFKTMNEGEKSSFQRKTNRDIRVKDGDALIRPDVAEDRHALIRISVNGWNLRTRRGDDLVDVPFSKSVLDKWLSAANPKIVADLEDAIRKANPWMVDDMTVEMIDDEIKRLEEMRRQIEGREEGKDF